MASHILKDKQALERYKKHCELIANSTLINPFESDKDKGLRINGLKNNFKDFVAYYFSHYSDSETPAFHVRIARKVRRNKKYKGWLKWARGHAKSVVAIVLLPIWLWINGDLNFLLVVGQNEDKAITLLSDLQAEFEHNQRLINDFGPQKLQGSWETGFFTTISGFKAKAIGMGQDPRGLRVGADRPDMVVADDWEIKETVKNPKRQDEYAEWFLRGVIPAMDNKNRRVLICQNHFAPRMIFSKIIAENESWDVDRVDAYNSVTYEPTWKEKYERWFFKEVEEEIGSIRAQAEYNNTPMVEGTIFTDEMIQWTSLPPLKSMTAIVGIWDVAYGGTATSDYNAVRVWGLYQGKKYLIDCFVKQSKVKDALNWIATYQKELPIGVSVPFRFEAQFWNDEIYRNIEEVEKAFKCNLNLVKMDRSTTKKFDRILEMHPQYQNSRIFYNHKLKSHNDTQVGLAQLKGIEPGYKTKDDAPDADKYAFDYLDTFESSTRTQSRTQKRESRKF
jgi:phage terminase large subunit-like protein